MSSRTRLGLALLASSLASIGLYVAGVFTNDTWDFAYLIWNLLLAWIPLGLMLWLLRTLRFRIWSNWLPLVITVLWLGFLPNSFYMITDFIHLQEEVRADLLFDVVMFSSFVLNGLLLGYISLHLMHQELLKRLSMTVGAAIVGAILLGCSFAIYVGRYLRWNTWDVVLNPTSLLFDVSDRVLHPLDHPQVVSTTISFFVLLTSIYGVVWYLVRHTSRQQKASATRT